MLVKLFKILSQKRYFVTAVVVLLIYLVIYLAATQQLIFSQRTEPSEGISVLKILPQWKELIFRQRSPFLFEPIGVFYLGPNVKLLLSIPNILLGLFLAVLVSSNLAVSYYNFRTLGLRKVSGLLNLLGTVPAIISGAACCVPTLILVIGLQLTATLAAVWAWFVPVSIVLLVISLVWSLRKFAPTGI